MSAPVESRVFGLDLLRALAIASVVLAHGGLAFILVTVVTHFFPGLNAYASWSGLLWHGGFVGVELFFVLSGFLIGRILLRSADGLGQGRSLLVFYFRRWFRTLPLFWLFIPLNVLLEYLLRDRRITAVEAVSHAFFTRNFGHISLSFFPESWSLAVEEWFYLLFPAALWLGIKITRNRFDRVFVTCAAGFYLFALAVRTWAAMQTGADWSGGQRCTVVFRFDALMTGVIAAWMATRFPAAWKRYAKLSAVAGVVVFLAAYATLWTFSRQGLGEAVPSFFAKTFRFNVISLGFALLLPVASLWRPASENAGHAAVRKIALWSYALYLVHWPLFQIVASPRLKGWQESWNGAAFLFVAKIAVAIGLSALLYHFYEAPCTRLREKAGSAFRSKTLVAPTAPSISG